MTPRRFERQWTGYNIGRCRAEGCASGGVRNFDGLCKACNTKGYAVTEMRERVKALSSREPKRHDLWQPKPPGKKPKKAERFIFAPAAAPRALKRGGRASD